ncbi:hypothetical protein M427DRAFT_58617 [Gonapodya prolifera JEL478]|uniref:Uncharacterized protein n=1 Tax=Gonapodya prolifera (strain JEL478) TaxID=1344416 RepID=A0A139A967_GONPJ|nr:hypothetical protein M427DRAFT_58617 [Gonapodya prolifera JEL478]|eukprot:KXS13362.1 hypothetical protein M427DRAFT_58617 [Gonapodya prolifera JEL478]
MKTSTKCHCRSRRLAEDRSWTQLERIATSTTLRRKEEVTLVLLSVEGMFLGDPFSCDPSSGVVWNLSLKYVPPTPPLLRDPVLLLSPHPKSRLERRWKVLRSPDPKLTGYHGKRGQHTLGIADPVVAGDILHIGSGLELTDLDLCLEIHLCFLSNPFEPTILTSNSFLPLSTPVAFLAWNLQAKVTLSMGPSTDLQM